MAFLILFALYGFTTLCCYFWIIFYFFYIVDIKNANMTHKMSDNLNIKELSQKADQWFA